MDLSLRQLRAAALVADTLSYARTAELLGYTEPAVHHQIRSLHEALGHVMFEKHGRGLRMTEAGARLLPHVLSVLAAADKLEACSIERNSLRSLSVAAGIVTGAYTLPTWLAQFAMARPDIAVQLQLGSAEDVARAVERGQSEIGISGRLSRVALSTSLHLVPWQEETYALYAGIRRSGGLSGHVVIFTVQTVTEALTQLLQQLESRGIKEPEIRFLASADAVKNHCQAGLGFALLRTRAAEADVHLGTLVRVDTGFGDIRDVVWICHGARTTLSDEARDFLDFLLADAARRGEAL